MPLVLLVVVLVLVLGGGGGYVGYTNWGPTWGGGISLTTILLIFLVLYALRR